ncbi:putative 26S proteasome regulatory subunit, partial [Gamsiella multidivaricata]
LRNDHKTVMLHIEEAIHAVHAEALAEKQSKEAERSQEEASRAAAASSSSSSSSIASATSTHPLYEDEERTLAPFARVNAVAPDSPAKNAGLLQGDMIVAFGVVNIRTTNVLKSLSAHVESRENKPIVVKVQRGEPTELQSVILVPKQGWGGRGLLGCHIVPV